MSKDRDRTSSTRFRAIAPVTGVTDGCKAVLTSRPDGLLILVLTGTASAVLALRIRQKLLRGDLAIKATDLLVDAGGLETYEADFVEGFADTLNEYRRAGGGRVAFSAAKPHIRLMAESVSMRLIGAGGSPIDVVDTRELAIAKLGRTFDGVA